MLKRYPWKNNDRVQTDGGHSHASDAQQRNYFSRSSLHRSKRTPYHLMTLFSRSLYCFVLWHALRLQVNWSKRVKPRQIISFWNPFLHVSIVLCWTDAWVMFQDIEIQFKTTTMLIKNLVGISITLSPRRESICCQGSSQTRNWATTGSRHLTRWYHAGGLVQPAACQSQFFFLPHFLSKLTRALWMKF